MLAESLKSLGLLIPSIMTILLGFGSRGWDSSLTVDSLGTNLGVATDFELFLRISLSAEHILGCVMFLMLHIAQEKGRSLFFMCFSNSFLESPAHL